jgi:hypothetical protein
LSIEIKKYKIFIIVFFGALLASCAHPKNNKAAFILYKNNQPFIRLTGKRVPLTHDLFGIFSNKLIDDTLLIQIPFLKEGIIAGKDIPVEEGYYKYQGHINIKKDSLIVNLQMLNTDDEKIEELSYNGVYNLIRK